MAALEQRPGIRGGFIHLPATPDLISAEGRPSLTQAKIVASLETALKTSILTEIDVRIQGGAVH